MKLKRCINHTIFFLMLTGIAFAPTLPRAQTVNTLSNVEFGNYDFAAIYNGNIQLGTNNSINVTGSGIAYSGGASRGHIRVTAPLTGIIDVKCDTEAELVAASASNLTIDALELAVTAGVGFGSGNSCNGLGGGDAVAVSVDIDANPNPDIYIGGQVSIPAPITLPHKHNYSTAGAGTPIMLSIVVQ